MRSRDSKAKAYAGPTRTLCSLGLIGSNTLLVTAGIVAIIAGLLLPRSSYLLDILLIFGASLAAATWMITFSAQSALQVASFPFLLVLTTCLHLVVSLASAKLIICQGRAGNIIDFFGWLFVKNNLPASFLIFSIMAMAVFVAICKAVKNMSKTATDFITDVVLDRRISLDNDLDAGLIDESGAADIREKTASEAVFFVAMTGAGRFMLCAAAIELGIIIATVAVAASIAVAAPAASGISVKTYMALVVGAAATIQTPALLTAFASLHLVRKSALPEINQAAEDDRSRRVKVVATEVTTANEQLRDPYPVIAGETESTESQTIEWHDKQSIEKEMKTKKDAGGLWIWEKIKDKGGYNAIAELLKIKSADTGKTVLMVAENIKDLPVTVPVNTAVRLAQKGRRSLLIDLDTKRAAISKVFDIDISKAETKPVKTCVSNLYVFSAVNFKKTDTAKITKLIAACEARCEHVIVYVPDVSILDEFSELLGSLPSAMLFSSEGKFKTKSAIDFHKKLTGSDCTLLNPEQILK